MTRATDPAALSLAEASALIARRALSPVELVRAVLARIAARDGALHAHITVLEEPALVAARAAEAAIMAGGPRSPLHGIPYGLKDNYATAGIRTTAASRARWAHVPATDATLHARLQAAGGILIGKHNTWEYGTGMGELQEDLPVPPPRNAWNPDYYTAGSSNGTGVAVAAGFCALGLGSDTGGSVRVPAAVHGLHGLKPTYGRLSRAGILPNAYTLDVAGPLTRRAKDAALAMNVLAGRDPLDPTSLDAPVPDFAARIEDGVVGLTIGVLRRFHERDYAADPEVVGAFENAVMVLRDLGARLVEVDVPWAVQEWRDCMRPISSAEALSIHGPDVRERFALMGSALQGKFLGAMAVTGAEYVTAQRWRRQMAEAMDAVVRPCDAVLMPCVMTRVPRWAEGEARFREFMMASATCVLNVSGHPASSICAGFDSAGLPLSLQLVSRHLEEATLLRVAHAFEEATGFWRKLPCA
ncbi:amidase [Siccirubricoccus phaeus]|uniref:amidase n=1 Tax=Siccirubricoccus phaeus TaxID=2595053 RepID=UPI00165CDAD2|nr:amidase [Siccirubricoccus phaeus]